MAVGTSSPFQAPHCTRYWQVDGAHETDRAPYLSKAASHISLGSKDSAANIVRITTPAKATAPSPGSIVTTEPNCTSAISTDSMKMSIIDQRPIVFTSR